MSSFGFFSTTAVFFWFAAYPVNFPGHPCRKHCVCDLKNSASSRKPVEFIITNSFICRNRKSSFFTIYLHYPCLVRRFGLAAEGTAIFAPNKAKKTKSTQRIILKTGDELFVLLPEQARESTNTRATSTAPVLIPGKSTLLQNLPETPPAANADSAASTKTAGRI